MRTWVVLNITMRVKCSESKAQVNQEEGIRASLQYNKTGVERRGSVEAEEGAEEKSEDDGRIVHNLIC